MLAPPGDNRLLGLTSKSTANVGLRLSAVVCLRARRTALLAEQQSSWCRF